MNWGCGRCFVTEAGMMRVAFTTSAVVNAFLGLFLSLDTLYWTTVGVGAFTYATLGLYYDTRA